MRLCVLPGAGQANGMIRPLRQRCCAAASAMESPVTTRDGFFWCEHCSHVVDPPERELVVYEDAALAQAARLKCPRCKRWTVRHREPAKEQTRDKWRQRIAKALNAPVTDERAAQFFSDLRRNLDNLTTG